MLQTAAIHDAPGMTANYNSNLHGVNYATHYMERTAKRHTTTVLECVTRDSGSRAHDCQSWNTDMYANYYSLTNINIPNIVGKIMNFHSLFNVALVFGSFSINLSPLEYLNFASFSVAHDSHSLSP